LRRALRPDRSRKYGRWALRIGLRTLVNNRCMALRLFAGLTEAYAVRSNCSDLTPQISSEIQYLDPSGLQSHVNHDLSTSRFSNPMKT
jgi:hypothetical protein